MTEALKKQYESFPYPHRDPAEEDRRLLKTFLDPLPALNHHGWRGRRDFRRGFRVLVAGGGTGDSSTFLAHQLQETDAEIVYVDLSEASMEIARERAGRRGLADRIQWRVGSLLDLPKWGYEPFDYVNCSGVLHHLPDPAAGLAALRSVLKEDGVLGIMVYAAYGRSGIYDRQAMLRRLLVDERDDGARIDAAKELLGSLPETNRYRWLPKELLPRDLDSDAGIYDLLLHSQDRPFTVPELYAWLQGSRLRLVDFVADLRAFYEPRFALRSAALLERAGRLPREERHALSELAWGCISRHAFWASPRAETEATAADPDNVPFFFGPQQGDPKVAAFLRSLRPGAPASFELGGGDVPRLMARVRLDEPACRFLALVDGKSTMGELAACVASDCGLGTAEAWAACIGAVETLSVADGILLRHVSVPAFAPAYPGVEASAPRVAA